MNSMLETIKVNIYHSPIAKNDLIYNMAKS